MIVTGIIFAVFYLSYDSEMISEVGTIINWSYLIFILAGISVLVFSITRAIAKWKEDPKSVKSSAAGILILLAVLSGSYLIGNGDLLSIPGYEGKENTYQWLKMADMWLYSLYILLGIGIIAALAGIIWSYIKKIR